jgi:hypothetical protein
MLCAACMGMGGLSVSRPSLMNTIRCSVTWHSEQTNVCRSTPRTVAVSSGTTFVRINSAPQAVQRITRTGTHTHRAPTRQWEYRTLAILWCGNPLRCGLRLLRVCRGGPGTQRTIRPSRPAGPCGAWWTLAGNDGEQPARARSAATGGIAERFAMTASSASCSASAGSSGLSFLILCTAAWACSCNGL